MSYSRETLVRSTLWKLLEKFSSQIVTLVVAVILARILMPRDYGVIAVLMVFISLLNVVVDGGLNNALIQKKGADNVDFSTIFHFCIGLSLLFYLMLFFAAPAVASFYGDDLFVPVLRVLGLNVIFNAFNSIQRAYIAKKMLFRKLFAASLGAALISGAGGIALALKGAGVWALVFQQVASQLAVTLILWFTVRWRPEAVFSRERFRSLFDYGWKIFLTNIIVAVYENIRGVVIWKVWQPASLAFFEKGRQLPTMFMTSINSSVQSILMPAFSEDQDDRERVKQMMRRSMKLTCFFVLPLLAGLMATARPLVHVLLTDKWMEAVPFIRIFCLGFMLMPIQSSNLVAIKALGYSDITLKLELLKKALEAVIMVGSFFIGLEAVAWGIVLHNLICLFINIHPNKKLLGYGAGEQFRDMAPLFLASGLMGGAVFLLEKLPLPGIPMLLLQLAAGIVLYIVLCRIFKVDSMDYCLEYIKSRKK